MWYNNNVVRRFFMAKMKRKRVASNKSKGQGHKLGYRQKDSME